jgi:hypothetical protein
MISAFNKGRVSEVERLDHKPPPQVVVVDELLVMHFIKGDVLLR